MRRCAVLLLFAALAAAEDPFAIPPPHDGFPVDVYARYAESLALVKARLEKDPADAAALDRALGLLAPFDREALLEGPVRAALRRDGLDERRRAALRGLLGHLLVLQVDGGGVVWVFAGGQIRVERAEVAPADKAKLEEAEGHLREAIRLDPRDARAREDLAAALDSLDEEKHRDEIARLRLEVGALAAAAAPGAPDAAEDEAARLRTQAAALEQQEEPDHAAALLLRKQALVLDHCSRTIPFAYDAPIYGPVSLLAPEAMVVANLTRTFRKRDGSVGSVAPLYYPAPEAQRVRILEGLAQDRSAVAGAVLLKAVGTEDDRLAGAAETSLLAGRHPAVIEHLPRLLGDAVYGPFLPVPGQARLVHLAAGLEVEAAVPVLARLLLRDEDLWTPRGIARALGALGGGADALLAVAQDPARDVYFRREAIFALGAVGPERLDEVPAEPYLELALAAARVRAEKGGPGRVLTGLDHPHEADDAARLCAELGLADAIPGLERFLQEKPEHYAAPLVRQALARLVAGTRG